MKTSCRPVIFIAAFLLAAAAYGQGPAPARPTPAIGVPSNEFFTWPDHRL
jgi:hypothetical protein